MYNVVEESPVDACYAVKCNTCGKTTWAVSTDRSFPIIIFSHLDRDVGNTLIR